ncbi:MAG: protein phosphatase 2C domain-containing protein [Planctomycetota bacterium]|nr:protein phosphatase 2C domain-containing protein [Planctomycetota bacterium]
MTEHQHNWTDCLSVIEITDKGMRRATNQDSSIVVMQEDQEGWEARGHLFVVCDGMGAHAAGELASGDAVVFIPHHYLVFQDLTPPAALRRAIEETNREIHQKGQVNPEFHNMGTTCSSLLLLPQGAVIGHVGDSRIYRRRDSAIEQLTFDHSLVWEMRAKGHQRDDIPSNVITRSLGPNPEVNVDCEGPFPIQKGDTFLICSDGLNGEVSDAEIGSAMAVLPPLEASQFLVDLANLRGGPDNITIIIVQVTGERVCTDVQSCQPFQTGKKKVIAKRKNPAFWISAIAFALAGLFLVIAGAFPIGLIGIGIGSLCALLGLFRMQSKDATVETVALDEPLGTGPHSKESCIPDKAILKKLLTTTSQIRDISKTSENRYDWSSFDEHFLEGTEYFHHQEYVKAYQALSKAISFIMNQFRSY